MKLFAFGLTLFCLCLYANKPETESNIQKLLKGSKPFACHVGKFKIIKVKQVGAFIKFSLEGSGILINPGSSSNHLTTLVKANPNLEFMVPNSDKYIAEGKYISVECGKTVSFGGGPFPMEFYVESK